MNIDELGSQRIDVVGYDGGFHEWCLQQSRFLKNCEFYKLDLVNLGDEIESKARTERRSPRSYLRKIVEHLLCIEYVSLDSGEKNIGHWYLEIQAFRRDVLTILNDSPGLKSALIEILEDEWVVCAQAASEKLQIIDGLDQSRRKILENIILLTRYDINEVVGFDLAEHRGKKSMSENVHQGWLFPQAVNRRIP